MERARAKMSGLVIFSSVRAISAGLCLVSLTVSILRVTIYLRGLDILVATVRLLPATDSPHCSRN